ncbi:hypothetical protein [Pararhizobium sp. PWRC1-1]|uniref:DUF5983 family protein n=1 Tax=Pararhizobium sp. PWRC1-1 TaxID=2804566 RepID=UPI003CF115FD
MRDIKLLSLSTAHLSEATASFLAVTDCMDWPALGGPYRDVGWVFHVDTGVAGLTDQPAFQDLYDAFRFAAERGYSVILFYDIEDAIDGLPVYRDLDTEYDVLYEGSLEWQAARQRSLGCRSPPKAVADAEDAFASITKLLATVHNNLFANLIKADEGEPKLDLQHLEERIETFRAQLNGFQTVLAYLGQHDTKD